MNNATEYVSVVELNVGDVVITDGIRVKLDTEPHVFRSNNCGCDNAPCEVRRFIGAIQNMDEVARMVRGLHDNGMWTIQGNHLAHVWRVTEDDAPAPQGWTHVGV